ncbi:6-carboxytetrahydropterin synthase QueD [Nocardia sp. NPDC088792]|uniref:6-carboxytetrahydropterin synthase QueD n=1 Tax=Nocardia sp. NPDC088792 TaxID=3364332 RepID=UPI0038080B6D
MNDEKTQDIFLPERRDAAVEQFVEISKKWTFDAAHHLPNHAGKCRNEHGHTYTVEVAVSGPVQPDRGRSDDGMVLDFADLSQVWKTSVEPYLDHRNLNESIGKLGCWPTTAENIVRWIGETFEKNGIAITSVSLWETPTSRATIHWRLS